MEIALIHNNQLILGPLPFNVRMINSELKDLGLNEAIGTQDQQNIPIHFMDGLTHLLIADKVIQPCDSRYYKIVDFNWSIINEGEAPVKVLFTYPLISKTLEEVKSEIKKEVSLERKRKEDKIINLNLNGVDIEVSTSREERQSMSSKLSASPGVHKFKFKNIWLEITEQELQYVINEVNKSIQDEFDWEFNKHLEIDECQSIEEIYNLGI